MTTTGLGYQLTAHAIDPARLDGVRAAGHDGFGNRLSLQRGPLLQFVGGNLLPASVRVVRHGIPGNLDLLRLRQGRVPHDDGVAHGTLTTATLTLLVTL